MAISANDHAPATPTIVRTDPPDDESGAVLCACGHPLDQHDSIATRYCDATISSGLKRGCVCSAVPGNYPGRM
jgi:hypothetical protein